MSVSDEFKAVVDGWLDDNGMDDMGLDPSDLLNKLAASRMAVIQLPEPDMQGGFGKVWTTSGRFNGPVGDVQVRPDGRIEIRDDYEHDYAPFDVLRDAAVLVAAVVATGEEQP